MGRVNMKRVVGGGLLAGLIINIGETILNVPLLGASMEAALQSRNLPPVGAGAIAGFVAGTFGIGLLLVWLYAAMRPRLGPGPKTAMAAALVVWLLAYLWPSIGHGLMGFMPVKLLTIGMLWGLGEVLIAALAGSWFYREV